MCKGWRCIKAVNEEQNSDPQMVNINVYALSSSFDAVELERHWFLKKTDLVLTKARVWFVCFEGLDFDKDIKAGIGYP
jgi:hypothetical protein